ncbi:MAG: DNA repair protein RecN [Bacteroidales bacterium]
MLKHLLVENYALIRKLDIDIDPGFTVITGETGAGKSILLGALSLILGQRADTRVLMDQQRKCIIEGTFHVHDIPLKHLFEKYQLDYDDICIFRREITPQGKSRAFVNDTPVTLNIVSELSSRLIDIHSQHQNLLIGETSFQFDVLDSFSANDASVNAYRKEYTRLVQQKNELLSMQEQEKRARAELDYFRFQWEELDQACLNAAEHVIMEEELGVMQHAEEIRMNLENATFLLDQADHNLLNGINQVLQLIRPLGRYNKKYEELQQRLESVLIEAKDLASEMAGMASEVVYEPEKASLLQQRLDLINKLLLKHHVTSIQELEAIREDYGQKIQAIDSLEDQIKELAQHVKEREEQLWQAAGQVSETRRAAVEAFEQQITGLLHQLAMPGARFHVVFTHHQVLTPNGIDGIRFLFNANIGGEPKEISKVASGGELSRLMLAIKSVISRKNLLPTIIFDEIDTGISGETASRVAQILQSMASNMQVITITHLPQIASRGQAHLLVYKNVENGTTSTSIKKTQDHERIDEIAKMLGGEKPSESMIKTAKELIFNGMIGS